MTFNTDKLHCKHLNKDNEVVISEVRLSKKVEITKEGLIAMLEEKLGAKVFDVVDAYEAHFCSCGDVSESPDTNVLCKECQSLYGHAFESDL